MGRQPTGTKQKILDAACQLFAEKGYREVTVQEVCRKADANIASINYYFGAKENLYVDVWECAFRITREKYFKDVMLCPEPEERLTAYVKARIATVLDEGPAGWLPRIIHNEMSSPSAVSCRGRLLQFLEDNLSQMYKLTKDFLGEAATDLQIRLALNSFHSQCIHLNALNARKLGLFADGKQTEKAKIKAEMIELIMGGLKGYRSRIERGES